MLNPSDIKFRSYADRPATPLGEETGLTSTPVSERPSPGATPRPQQTTDPYRYQPAMMYSRPELTALRRHSSNYAQAQAAAFSGFTPITSDEKHPTREEEQRPGAPPRSYSFSSEDLKRSNYEYLLKDESKQDDSDDKKGPLSPGVGNSEAKGRDFRSTSTSEAIEEK